MLLLTGAVVTGLLITGGIDLFCSFTTGSVKQNEKFMVYLDTPRLLTDKNPEHTANMAQF